MQYFCILFFVAVSQGFVVKDTKVEKSELSVPDIHTVWVFDHGVVKLEWTAVTSTDPRDPVLGYKLNVWELPNAKVIKNEIVDGVKTLNETELLPELTVWERPNENVIKYEIVDGVKTLVETERLPEETHDIATTNLNEYITDDTNFTVRNLKFFVWYRFRVNAFTKTRESGLSDAWGIFLRQNETSKYSYLYTTTIAN